MTHSYVTDTDADIDTDIDTDTDKDTDTDTNTDTYFDRIQGSFRPIQGSFDRKYHQFNPP